MASESTPSPSDSKARPIALTISFRGALYTITLPSSSPLSVLHARLEEFSAVPSPLQKLLYKGKKVTWSSEEAAQSTTVEDAGLKDGMKAQLLGSTLKEVEVLKKEEGEYMRKERIMKERALKAPVKLRSTGSRLNSTLSPSVQYRFHDIQPLSHLPNPASALSLLQKLASDPAINHVMQMHQFSVGLLTELAPHEHPGLLGLNENGGMAIKLRLRTDRYDGFRLYSEVRRVLCHELTHNVWGNHDEVFKELNSKLNREVAEYERSVTMGTHYLASDASQDVYQPSSDLEAETRVHILGGSTSRDLSSELPEERRRRILEATMNRLRKEEEEIEHSCGTGQRSDLLSDE